MSLSSLIATDFVRDAFKQAFPKPEARLAAISHEMIPSTGQPQLVGTAYDYLVRFGIQRRGDIQVHSGDWVAETTRGRAGWYDAPILHAFEAATAAHGRYLESGDLEDELFGAALDLARLDISFRSGYPPEGLGVEEPALICELRELLADSTDVLQQAKQSAWLNPTFGSWSRRIGGADADLVLDGELVELKTVRERKVRLSDWHQLLGYAFLADLAREDGEEDVPEINSASVYLSRYGAWWLVDLTAYKSCSSWTTFKGWMRKWYPEAS